MLLLLELMPYVLSSERMLYVTSTLQQHCWFQFVLFCISFFFYLVYNSMTSFQWDLVTYSKLLIF